MNDSIKHSDDEVVCTVTYTWGQVKTFLKEHGGCATDSNAEALLAECGNGSIETGKDNLFCDAYDEIEQCLCISLDADNLPDKPWYDRPNGEWVYDREEPADHHDADEDEAWYGTYCHVGIHGGNQCARNQGRRMGVRRMRTPHHPRLHRQPLKKIGGCHPSVTGRQTP